MPVPLAQSGLTGFLTSRCEGARGPGEEEGSERALKEES